MGKFVLIIAALLTPNRGTKDMIIGCPTLECVASKIVMAKESPRTVRIRVFNKEDVPLLAGSDNSVEPPLLDIWFK